MSRPDRRSERARRASFLVPEVLQTSLMDCGPAALKAVLEGFGLEVRYEWIRELCQTSVDGTSIDALAALGNRLGLRAHEIVASHDSLLLPESRSLPAIAVQRTGGGVLHFIVLWRTLGPYVQILDPASGRRWVRGERLLRDLPYFPIPITASRWRAWAASSDNLDPLRARMRLLGIGASGADALIARAGADPGWRAFSALDATVRMTARMLAAHAVSRGRDAERLCGSIYERALVAEDPFQVIPRGFWSAVAGKAPDKLTVHGPVIVHFERVSDDAVPVAEPTGALRGSAERTAELIAEAEPTGELPNADTLPLGARRELAAASISPLRVMWQMARADAPGALAMVAIALVCSAIVAGIDAVLLRTLFDVARRLTLSEQRLVGLVALTLFAASALVLERFLAGALARLGRSLELRARVAFLTKLPRLADQYLRSRPTSDMTSRAHTMHLLRDAPEMASRVARAVCSMIVTAAGIAWLYPGGAPAAVGAALLAIVALYPARRSLREGTMRLRTHTAALERFCLDALLGTVPIRVHGAARSVEREHEALLVEWSATARAVHRQTTLVVGAQGITTTVVAASIVASYVAMGLPPSSILLLAFWALRIAATGHELVSGWLGLRNISNVALRLFAPLAASEETTAPAERDAPEPASVGPRRGPRLQLERVTVRAAGHPVLRDVTLDIAPGSHVAIVGASGAGKSSLLGVLLGWLSVSEGTLRVDGAAWGPSTLASLRAMTAWVDPAISIWKRSLLENLTFGSEHEPVSNLSSAMADADLADVLEVLPEGMQTDLGEGGARLSGGQGQRVRLGRAMMRASARLVLLDEPFRGLERARRQELMRRVRARHAGSTLLFVSHDVRDTLGFDRVLVIDGGRVIEDGEPRALFAEASSRYRALDEADGQLRRKVFAAGRWRQLRLDDGRLMDTEPDAQREAAE